MPSEHYGKIHLISPHHPDGAVEPALRCSGMHLSFAYGSNLDLTQMARRCEGARVQSAGWLEDHVIAFAGFSPRRHGAVATVVRAPGQNVSGLLYLLSDEHLRVLDHHEGTPQVYRRDTHIIQDPRGMAHRAHVYVHTEPPGGSHGPSVAYVEQIKRAYEQHGFDVAPLLAALHTSG